MGEVREQVSPVQIDYVCDECGIGRMRKTGEFTMVDGVTRHRCNNVDCGHQQDLKGIVYPFIVYETKTIVATEPPAPPDPAMMSDEPEPKTEPVSEIEQQIPEVPSATEQPVPERMDFPVGGKES